MSFISPAARSALCSVLPPASKQCWHCLLLLFFCVCVCWTVVRCAGLFRFCWLRLFCGVIVFAHMLCGAALPSDARQTQLHMLNPCRWQRTATVARSTGGSINCTARTLAPRVCGSQRAVDCHAKCVLFSLFLCLCCVFVLVSCALRPRPRRKCFLPVLCGTGLVVTHSALLRCLPHAQAQQQVRQQFVDSIGCCGAYTAIFSLEWVPRRCV